MINEKLVHTPEFEQKLAHEIERKFLPIFPEQLNEYRQIATPIEQFYLSHPSEPFSLRMREQLVDGQLEYVATLKDSGTVTSGGLDRIEVNTPVSPELFQQYRTPDVPVLRKLRAEPLPGVIVDFYEDGSMQVESESPAHWQEFIDRHGDCFMDVTGDRQVNNEWRAHLAFRRANSGLETLKALGDLEPGDILNDVLANKSPGRVTIAHITGRSGSGKSTIVKDVQAGLNELGIASVTLSTDDYHRGASWLNEYNGGQPWTKWDDAIVYDTQAMARDIAELQAGRPIWRRWIDFTDVEPKYDEALQPAPVVIIEGIYAASSDITREDHLMYEMTTPLATCIGRRLLRDLRERPQFADPVGSLGYMLSEAEIAYRKQKAPAATA